MDLPTWEQIEHNTVECYQAARNQISDAADWLRSDWAPAGTSLPDGAAARRARLQEINRQIKTLIDEAKNVLHS